ncbi:MAG: hypothetical protein KDK96_11150 [Chlamydiia bacterium]|nr:hypothetical protein [Chlamydiia bacterium]
MQTNLRYFTFLVTAIFFIAHIAIADEIADEILEKIILNGDCCVRSYEKDKIYLNHENIYPMHNGLFLNLNDHDYLPLNHLQSDNKGCWIPIPCKDISIYKPCPNCGELYLISCKNPNCPSNKNKKKK